MQNSVVFPKKYVSAMESYTIHVFHRKNISQRVPRGAKQAPRSPKRPQGILRTKKEQIRLSNQQKINPARPQPGVSTSTQKVSQGPTVDTPWETIFNGQK